MSNKKLGQQCAFPRTGYSDPNKDNGTNYDTSPQYGMSTRLFIATMAMQGLIQAGFISANSNAKQAFIMADHLLAKESYTSEELKDLSKDGRL